MVRKQLLITPDQNSKLAAIAAELARPESEIVREALDEWFKKQAEGVADWKSALRQASGIWKDRTDLEDLMPRLRQSWNRQALISSRKPAAKRR